MQNLQALNWNAEEAGATLYAKVAGDNKNEEVAGATL
jgi:hypothetical protein